MRIDAYNQISQLYQASKPKKITKKSEATVKRAVYRIQQGSGLSGGEESTCSSTGYPREKLAALEGADCIRQL